MNDGKNMGYATYWTELCEYDLKTARWMYWTRRYLYVAFMCHQAVEKQLKANYVARHAPETLPHSHKLAEIATKAGLFDEMSEEQRGFLRELTPMNIEARYPKSKRRIMEALSRQYCKSLLSKTERMIRWLREK